jgi:hypothetical protein
VLTVRVEGPQAVFLQHEATQIIERVNAFLGYGAIGRLRIVQAPITPLKATAAAATRALSASEEAELGARVAEVDGGPLRAALQRLGRGVLSERGR